MNNCLSKKRPFIVLLFFCVFIFPRPSLAWNTLTDTTDLYCQQDKTVLNCHHRNLEPVSTAAITAVSTDKELPLTLHPEKNGSTAILFMVDTSDPARQNVIEQNKSHIKSLIAKAKSHHKLGLATFDKALRIESSVGTSAFLLSKKLDNIKAVGKTTELYRNLLKAIGYLKSVDAERKVIFLFSDGQAEDKAYFHSDVINAARKFGIVINAIGYPRTVSLSVALQTLRRLSEETGGNYVETDINYALPGTYFTTPFSNIDTSNKFSIALEDVNSNEIILSFKRNNKTEKIKVPVDTAPLEKTPPETIPKEQVSTPPNNEKTNITPAPVTIVTKQANDQAINLWLWYGLPAAFIIIIVFILITLFLLWYRQPEAKNKTETEYKPYAYLIANDERKTRYPITRTIWRIGRSKDNELPLDDTSVSRRHAEIHRNTNGSFDIIDMNSMNGIYINNEKIGKAILQEGDVIEIGDIFLQFTQLASDHSIEDSTVMQKTKTPSVH